MTVSDALDIVHELACLNQLDELEISGDEFLAAHARWQRDALDRLGGLLFEHRLPRCLRAGPGLALPASARHGSDRPVERGADLPRPGPGCRTTGFERIVAEVCLGKVGAVCAREVSRFARNSRDWQQLIEMCRVVDTVLIDQETVYAPRHGNDRLLLGLKGSLNEYELDLLRQRSLSARYEKARRGDDAMMAEPAVDCRSGAQSSREPAPPVRPGRARSGAGVGHRRGDRRRPRPLRFGDCTARLREAARRHLPGPRRRRGFDRGRADEPGQALARPRIPVESACRERAAP